MTEDTLQDLVKGGYEEVAIFRILKNKTGAYAVDVWQHPDLTIEEVKKAVIKWGMTHDSP